jgi:hypothetical protein
VKFKVKAVKKGLGCNLADTNPVKDFKCKLNIKKNEFQNIQTEK